MTNKEEIFLPIGFHLDAKRAMAFCRVDDIPGRIFFVHGKHDSLSEFNRRKISVPIKYTKKVAHGNADFFAASDFKHEKVAVVLYIKGKVRKLMIAGSKDGLVWQEKSILSGVKERGVIVPNFLYENKHVLLYGESSIQIAFSKDLKKWVKEKNAILKPRPGFFDKEGIKIISIHTISKGILVLYDASQYEKSSYRIQIGAAIFSSQNPKNLIWRSDVPIFDDRSQNQILDCKGTILHNDKIFSYWVSKEGETTVMSFFNLFSEYIIGSESKKLVRHESNPIIKPKDEGFMSHGTFNPTAVKIGDDIHLFFRAIGPDGISRIGYAKSKDGITIDEVYPESVFDLHYSHFGLKKGEKRYDPVMYPSGGSWGGCEDPRTVIIGDRVYMTFNAFDNWNNIRIGLASIKIEDLLKKNWNWSEPALISPYGERHKNWVLFPEKINGKFGILHSINAETPDKVCIEYFDDLDPKNIVKNPFKSADPQILPNKAVAWHIRMRSAGPPPIYTKDGWLILYHATDKNAWQYKIGAMLLDRSDPTKVIARSTLPLLIPDMWYENDWKPGIVYSAGLVEKDDTLFVYYGGGDKYVCVATTSLSKFLKNLKENKQEEFINTKVSFN